MRDDTGKQIGTGALLSRCATRFCGEDLLVADTNLRKSG
jgi:hypothetical protein